MDFRQARSEYLQLRHAFRSGQITAEEFEKKVNAMIIHDHDQLWMIGVKSGKWYRRVGKTWVEDVPEIPSSTEPVKSTQNRKQHSLKEQFDAVYAAKPMETPSEKSFRHLTTGFSAAFIVLLLLAAAAALMLTGVIDPPAALSSLFTTSANETDGIGAADTEIIATNLAGNLVSLPESGLAIPAELARQDFLYSKDILRTWQLRDASNEQLTFKKDGTLRAFSEADGYDYSGWFSFEDDHTLLLFLGDGAVRSTVWIDAGVLTLVINDQPLVYDRVE